MKAKRKRPYVKVMNIKDGSIREVIYSTEKPKEADFKEDESVIYCIGPFRTNDAAELFKSNPNKYKTVTEAEKASAKFGFR